MQKSNLIERNIVWLGGVVVLVDQVSKAIFSSKIVNEGGVFGIGKDLPWLALSLVSLSLLAWMYTKSVGVRERYALMIIMASGLSNFIDRLLLGGVRDFIYWPSLNVYGNVADLLLTVGVVVIIIDYLGLIKEGRVK